MKKFILPIILYLAFLSMSWNLDFTKMLSIDRIHALNFAGAHYHCSPNEPPKPLPSLIGYFCPAGEYKYINALLLTLLVTAFLSISLSVTGDIQAGAAAAFLLLFADQLAWHIIVGVTLPYLVLMLWSTAFYLRGGMGKTSFMLFLAGLVRPEAWVLGAIFMFRYVLNYFYKEKAPKEEVVKNIFFNGSCALAAKTFAVAVLPLFASLLWVFFDLRVSNSAFHEAARYAAAHIFSTDKIALLGYALTQIIFFISPKIPFVALGIVAMFLMVKRCGWTKTLILAVPAAVVTLFYAALYLTGHAPLFPRYFLFPAAICYFTACLIPGLIFHKFPIARGLVLVLVCVFCFDSTVAMKYIAGNEKRKYVSHAVAEAVTYLKEINPQGKIIDGFSHDVFALALGEKASHQLVTAEEASDPEIFKQVYYIVWVVGDNPRANKIRGFSVCKVIDNGLAIIYKKEI
jgi:hypothetical protein